MRRAAGIILLILGGTVVSMSLPSLLSQLLRPVTIHANVALAAGGLLIGAIIVAGGVSAIMKRRFWLSVSGAICLMLVAAAATVLLLHWWRWAAIPGHESTAAWQLIWSTPAWGICGLPSLLALVFLVKRRSEFRA